VPRPRRIRLSAVLCLVLGAVCSAPAAALPPGRSGSYGGGAVRDYLQFVSLRVAPGGGLTAHTTLVTRCAPRFGDQLTESISVKGVRLDERGRYSARSSFSDAVDPGVRLTGGMVAEGTVSFSARVLAGGLARGTVRVRTTYRESEGGPEVSSCDTGSIRWAARRPPPDAGAGRLRLQPGTHRGTTTGGEPILVRVTDRGRVVRRAGLTARVDCPSAVGLPLDIVAQRVRVRRGRFGAAGDFAREFTDSGGTQLVERYAWELRGRFGSRGARGTFELDGVVRRKGDDRRVDACGTGKIAWRAAR
jgi:hypothetical protein